MADTVHLFRLNPWLLELDSSKWRPEQRTLKISLQLILNSRPLKHGREELPHVRGQGQKPGGSHAQRAAAKRSYPTSEVRGSGRECQAATTQEPPRRATQSEVRGSGQEELPYAPTPEARGGSLEDQPHVQGAVAVWGQEGLEDLSHVEGQEGRR